MALGHVEDRPMSRKRHRPEEIVAKLRQVEVLTAQGRTVAEAIRSIGVTEVTLGSSPRAGLRDELLNGEIFSTLQEAKVVIEGWRRHLYEVPFVKSVHGSADGSRGWRDRLSVL